MFEKNFKILIYSPVFLEKIYIVEECGVTFICDNNNPISCRVSLILNF